MPFKPRTARWIRPGRVLRAPLVCLLLLATLTLPALAVQEAAQEAKWGPCYARWTDTELIVGNNHIERKWRIEGDLLRATSFYDRDAKMEWIKTPPAPAQTAQGKLTVTAKNGIFSWAQAPSLAVEVSSGKTIAYVMQVFPDARGIEMDVQPGQPIPARSGNATQGQNAASIAEHGAVDPGKGKGPKPPLTPDDLSLVPQHLRLTQVSFTTDTDHHNQIVWTREWMFMNNEDDIVLHGDLFLAEDVVTGSGLIFLKQAPLPEDRPVQTESDLQVISSPRTFRFFSQGYASVVLAYRGGRSGRIETLQTYQRQLRQYVPNRDGVLLTNTWGDRNRDSRNTSAFVEKEIAEGIDLGVDVVQIDDGWQAGRSTNSARGAGLANGFQSAEHAFWAVDATRYPAGIDPLVARLKSHGMKLGLWFAPDSSQDFGNWQRDAATILDFYRKQGVAYFKFDSIHMASPRAEANLHLLFDRILEESKGQVVIDLDVTGQGRRPGYFGMMSSGPIFVENRYSDYHRYFPHLTLRNLWQLSEYVDPLRLRMEFLNNTRRTELYPDDPLAPAKYTPDALFATVMFANPLGWLEISSLPPEFVASAKPLIKTWKQEREALYRGTIIPIGEAPDGVVWTGFASISHTSPGGSMLLFRELNEKADWSVEIPLLAQPPGKATVLAGHGTAKIEGGRLVVHIPETLEYLWVKLN